MILRVLAAAGLALAAAHGASRDMDRVIVLVNDEVPPAPGTGDKGASVYVGEYYAGRRGVPRANIVHLSIPLACCEHDPLAWDSWNIQWDRFEETIRKPLKRWLVRRRLTENVDYVVTTFGIPLRVKPPPESGSAEPLSIDSLLASLNSGDDRIHIPNPYRAGATEHKAHIREWKNPAGWKLYLVTRLDGPSPAIATGLVDKAMSAEPALKKTDGIGYFDYRHITCCPGQGYYEGDQSVMDAYVLSAANGFRSVLNDQAKTKQMIQQAPRALWAWGWYSGTKTWEGYHFVNGAVGAQLTSYTAASIRTMSPGAWVYVWLKAGITATWGAVSEPTVAGYARGDTLLNHLWMGYNFAESAYLAAPVLNHTMVFVGDPLYAPEIFRR